MVEGSFERYTKKWVGHRSVWHVAHHGVHPSTVRSRQYAHTTDPLRGQETLGQLTTTRVQVEAGVG